MTFDTTTIIVIIAVLAVLILAFLVMRPRRQRIGREPSQQAETYVASRDRPYVTAKREEGDWVTDEVAAATTDVAGEVLGVDAHRELGEMAGRADDLQRLKGVGPKFAAMLGQQGIVRFDQLASLSDNEVAVLDEKLGAFRGRLARDRVREQADYLARGDVDGFEERFGKLGG